MSIIVRQLSRADDAQIAALWRAALEQRRRDLGVEPPTSKSEAVLARPGAFGVGVDADGELLALAIAMPARGDDARSDLNTPGLAHISSVATLPGHWGRGYGGRVVRAVMSHATRRGYARAQLWTHVSNPAAQRLYTREGFTDTGRRGSDLNGEPIMHYLRQLPDLPLRARPAARLVCLDPQDRVLLIHWRDPDDGFQLWEPPGGGIDPGETAYEAVVREWVEETGLGVPDPVVGPTDVARDEIFDGGRGVVDEQFFVGRAAESGTPRPDLGTEVEQVTFLGHAWLPWQELDTLDDPVVPDLLAVLRRLVPDGPWA